MEGGTGLATATAALPGLLLLLLWSGLAAWGLGLPLASTLAHGGWTRPNYRQQMVPVAAGLVFVLPAIAAVAAAFSLGWVEGRTSLVWITASLSMALIGLLDDGAGDHRDRGWHGHLRAWRQERRLSTGLLKALVGGLLGLWIAGFWPLPASQWLERLGLAALLALSINTFNLLDLRPGRAVKVFLASSGLPALVAGSMWLITAGSSRQGGGSGLAAPVVGWVGSLAGGRLAGVGWGQISLGWLALVATAVVMGYGPRDWRGVFMMGDTGANVLGFWAGWTWATFLPPPAWWGVLGGLVGFHWFCERQSLSEWVDRHPFWRRLDRWGRSQR